MQVHVISEYDDFVALQGVWENVLKRSRDDTIYLTHEWFRCWWLSYGQGKQLSVILIKDRDDVIGIAPFYAVKGLYRRLIPVREVRFCVNEMSPRVNFVAVRDREEVVVRSVLEYLCDRRQSWDILRLSKLHAGSFTYEVLQRVLCEKKLLARMSESYKCPYFYADGTWDAYYKDRPASLRKRMRNTLNRVTRFGDVVIEKIEEKDRLDAALRTIYAVSGRSWKHAVGKSLLKRKSQLAFYDHITRRMGEKGWIRVWLLKSRGRCLAFEYHLIYNGVAYPIRADFDEEYRAISPGSFLEYNIIRTLFQDSRVREYDFCGDNYRYMLNWTQLVKEHVDIAIFNKRLSSRSLGWVECGLIPLAKKAVGLCVHSETKEKFCRRR